MPSMYTHKHKKVPGPSRTKSRHPSQPISKVQRQSSRKAMGIFKMQAEWSSDNERLNVRKAMLQKHGLAPKMKGRRKI